MEEWNILEHIFYDFLVDMVTKKIVQLLIKNPSLYENVMNLFEHDMET